MSMTRDLLKKILESSKKKRSCVISDAGTDEYEVVDKSVLNEVQSYLEEHFPITSVARGDLTDYFPAPLVARLDDGDLEYLAEKMADDYINQLFWEHLQILAEDMIKDAEKDMIDEWPDNELATHIGEKFHFDENQAHFEQRIKNTQV